MKTMKKWMVTGFATVMLMANAQAAVIQWGVDADYITWGENPAGIASGSPQQYLFLISADDMAAVAEMIRADAFDASIGGMILDARVVFPPSPEPGPFFFTADVPDVTHVSVVRLVELTPFWAGRLGGTFLWQIIQPIELEDSSAVLAPHNATDVFDSGYVSLISNLPVIPEPLTTGLALAGVALLLAQRRRK